MPRLLTTGKAGRLFGVSHRTILNWIRSGRMKAYPLPGRRGDWRISAAECVRIMRQRNLPIPEHLLTDAARPLPAESETAPFLTTGQLGKLLGVSHRTALRWIKDGTVQASFLPGRGDSRIARDEYIRLLKEAGMPVPPEPEANTVPQKQTRHRGRKPRMLRKDSLTSGELAEQTGIGVRTVLRWIQQERLDAWRPPGRLGHYHIHIDECIRFLEENNIPVPDMLRLKQEQADRSAAPAEDHDSDLP